MRVEDTLMKDEEKELRQQDAEDTKQPEQDVDFEVTNETTEKSAIGDDAEPEEQPKKAKHKKRKGKKTSVFQRMKQEASEGDEKPSGSLRLRDILGGDHLITLVRNQIGIIVLIVLIATVYVAVRYQCQQDIIDINQLESEVTDAKYKAMSSSSNLTEISRQSNILTVLRAHGDSLLKPSKQPPFNVFVPEVAEEK